MSKMSEIKVIMLALLALWTSCENASGTGTGTGATTHHLLFPKLGEIQPPGGLQSPYAKTQPQRRYAVHEDSVPALYHQHHESDHGNHHEETSDGDEHDHHAYPQYAYKYAVHDDHTGDMKKAWEHRDGDVTHGGYSLVEPDGHIRIVEYTVTKHGGFQATVKREPYH